MFEFIKKISDAMTGLLKSIFGSKNEREVKKLWPHVREINQIEEGLHALTDDEFSAAKARLLG